MGNSGNAGRVKGGLISTFAWFWAAIGLVSGAETGQWVSAQILHFPYISLFPKS